MNKTYTPEEIQQILNKHEGKRTAQLGYIKKYFKTEKGRNAHRRSTQRSYRRSKIKKLLKLIDETTDEYLINEYQQKIEKCKDEIQMLYIIKRKKNCFFK